MSHLKLAFIFLFIFSALASCSDDDSNGSSAGNIFGDGGGSGGGGGSNLPALTGVSVSSNHGKTPFNSNFSLGVQGVQNSDRLEIFTDAACSGNAVDNPPPLTNVQNSLYTYGRSLNPDLEGQHTFAVQVNRQGYQPGCFATTIDYRSVGISAGGEHSCAILHNGLLKCWGEGNNGRLGSGATDDLGDGEDGFNLPPVRIGGDLRLRPRKVLADGYANTCALMDDKHLYCFGAGATGILGTGNTNDVGDVPGQMEALSAVDLGNALGTPHLVWDFAMGGDSTNSRGHICALLGEQESDLTLKCWGSNNDGQLGYGDTTTRGTGSNEMGNSLLEVNLGTDSQGTNLRPVQVALGRAHTCVLLNDDSVKCWGDNNSGQLGNGTTGTDVDQPAATAVNLGTDRTAVAIAAGGDHTCALLDNNELKCWGENGNGQLGIGTNADANAPGAAANFGSQTAVAMALGDSHTCALLNNDELKCWGKGDDGQLGQGGMSDTNAPGTEVSLGQGRTAISITAGASHTCARLDDNTFKCWGNGANGRLGLGSPTSIGQPGNAINLADGYYPVRGLSMGANHACAIFGLGNVKCWGGANSYGQLGQGNSDQIGHASAGASDQLHEIDPVNLGEGVTALQVAAGTNHSCAVVRTATNDQRVKCWGRNNVGQLGLGDTDDRGDAAGEMGANLASINFGSASVEEIGAGADFTCVRLDDATVRCWGENGAGQLGITGSTDDIGDDEAVDSSAVTVTFPTGRTPRTLSVGSNHACALLDNNDVACWGGNDRGQLGRGTIGTNETDANGIVGGSLKADVVVAGNETTCVIENSTSNVRCWGSNISGKLGINNSLPAEILAPQNAVDLFTGINNDGVSLLGLGGAHVCAAANNAGGNLICWGSNSQGQLGQGQTFSELGAIGITGTQVSQANPLNLGIILALSLGGPQGCIINGHFQVQCWGDNDRGKLGLGNTYDYGDAAGEIGQMGEKLNFGGVEIGGMAYTQATLAGLSGVWEDSEGVSFNSQIEGSFSGVEEYDTVQIFPNGRCEGVASQDITIGAGRSSFDYRESINPDLERTAFSVRVDRGGIASNCFSLNPKYRTLSVSAGGEHSCAITGNGLLKCWGEGDDGRLGSGATVDLGDNNNEDGIDLNPVNLAGQIRERVRKVVAGGSHTCALMEDRRLYCFGENASGQLGLGHTNDTGDAAGEMEELLPVAVGTTSGGDPLPVWDFDLGENHTCALVGEQSDALALKCWGENGNGQLGDGNSVTDVSDPSSATAVNFGSNINPVAISVGGNHTCALLSNDELKCWGSNADGQLGDGNSPNNADSPPAGEINLGIGRTAVAISAGGSHTCALLDNSDLKCWGGNANGQLGSGTNSPTNTPGSLIDLGATFIPAAVSAGGSHTCAISRNSTGTGGALKCWGEGTNGRLGVGNTNDITLPNANTSDVTISGGTQVVAISAGAAHSCALLSNNSIHCWGSAASGRLLNSSGSSDQNVPGTALSLAETYYPVRGIAMGPSHACGILGPGLVKCWGANTDGQLGQGDTQQIGHNTTNTLTSIPPVELGAGVTALKVAVGTSHSCAVVRDAANNQGVKCWGKNDLGQMGLGTVASPIDKVGDGPGEMSNIPLLDFGEDILEIGAGVDFTCVLLGDDTVRCWGKNDVGQLGQNSSVNIGDDDWTPPEQGQRTLDISSVTAVNFPSAETTPPVSLSVGTNHACVRFQSRNILCWGGNAKGQLGISGNTNNLGDDSTRAVSGATVIAASAVRVVAGDETTCVVNNNNSVRCLGDNTNGEMGINDITTTEYDQLQAAVDLVSTGDDTAYWLGLGGGHVCISLLWTSSVARGELVCWGDNGAGQLGQGNTQGLGIDSTNTVQSGTAIDLDGVLALSLGGDSTCAINADFQAQCWGEGGSGQLGQGAATNIGNSGGSVVNPTPLVFGTFSIP